METDTVTTSEKKRGKSFGDNIKRTLEIVGSLSFITILVLNLISINKIVNNGTYSNEIVGSCMDKYSKISEKIRRYNNNQEKNSIEIDNLMYDYFDLTNEELFYIRNEIVNPEVRNDWMTGIIKQLRKFKKEKDYELILNQYKRISTTFNIDLGQIDVDNISINTINDCLERLKKYNSNK